VPQLAPQSPPPPVIERHPGVGKPVEVFGGTAIVTGRLPPDAVHPARAFDRNSTTDVEEEFADHPSAPGQVASIAFVYRPGHERAILAYAITSSEAAPSGSDPMTWRLIGVMADGSEHLLDQRQGEAFSARTERRVFTIAGPSPACFSYRLDVSAVADGGSRLRLAEIEFINPR
jgi:hypothetical protein